MSDGTGFTRGDAAGRLGRRRLLLVVAGALALVAAIAVALALFAGPGDPEPICPDDRACANPPIGPPVAEKQATPSPHLGLQIEYSGSLWRKLEETASSIKLGFGPTSQVLKVEAVPASQGSPEQLVAAKKDEIGEKLLGLHTDTNRAHQYPDPQIAYHEGVGAVLVGNLNVPQGVGRQYEVIITAATAGDVHLIGTLSVATDDIEAHAPSKKPEDVQGTRRNLLQAADQVLNTIRVPGEGPTAAVASPDDQHAATQGDHVLSQGPTDPAKVIDFSLVLEQPGEARLHRFVADVQNPDSPRYRHFLSAAEIGSRFGLPGRAVDHVRRAVKLTGLTVTTAYPQRTAIEVRGTVAQVSRVFGIRFEDYTDASGKPFYAPIGTPRVPASINRQVVGVTGLSNRPVARIDSVPAGGLKPVNVANAYNVKPMYDRGFRGEGQSVAIISAGAFSDEDLAAFEKQTDITGAPPAEHVPIAGGTPKETIPGASGEADLDVQVIRGVAPRAKILSFEVPMSDSFYATAVNAIVQDGRANTVSLSIGSCDFAESDFTGLSDSDKQRLRARLLSRKADQKALEIAAARGINVFSSSGDTGAYCFLQNNPEGFFLSTSFPNVSSNLVSVGGTTIAVTPDGGYVEEHGWEEPMSIWGGGGGLSSSVERPPWQAGPGVDNSDSNGKRQVPDVSAVGDQATGFFMVTDHQPQQAGGTSASAPFWAGSMSLIRQFAQKSGAGEIGFANPIFYKLAAGNDSPFHDVVKGGNVHYNAGPGWDYSTGLGSPNVTKLADRIIDFLKQR